MEVCVSHQLGIAANKNNKNKFRGTKEGIRILPLQSTTRDPIHGGVVERIIAPNKNIHENTNDVEQRNNERGHDDNEFEFEQDDDGIERRINNTY